MDPVVVLALVALSAVGALALTLPPASTGAAHAEAAPAAAAAVAADPPSRLAPQEPLAKAAEAAPEWREQSFASLTILDARTVAAGDLRITLAGLALPRADEICPTVSRAASSLARSAAPPSSNS